MQRLRRKVDKATKKIAKVLRKLKSDFLRYSPRGGRQSIAEAIDRIAASVMGGLRSGLSGLLRGGFSSNGRPGEAGGGEANLRRLYQEFKETWRRDCLDGVEAYWKLSVAMVRANPRTDRRKLRRVGKKLARRCHATQPEGD